jgi:hypothetical protein
MRFDSRDLTIKLWAQTGASEVCCGCSDTQDKDKCPQCSATQPGCQGCSATPPACQGCSATQQGRHRDAFLDGPAGALPLLRRQLQEALAGATR